MANSATSVLPAPVGAETITDWPSRMARMASRWKGSSGNVYRLVNDSSNPSLLMVQPPACSSRRS